MSRSSNDEEVEQFTFIDLFCGCGGFSLGMDRAGFRCLAVVDNNPEAAIVFATNFPDVPHVLEKDLEKFSPEKMAALLGAETVDVIVGGPPCQGFSSVRKVDGSNHGSRVKRDKRRFLYRHFLRYVEFFKPKVFVMENMLGIQSAAKGTFFTAVQAAKHHHREELCSTIVAHLSKDGLMFIHPTQNRSLTPREAARVQSFPDGFDFPVRRNSPIPSDRT